MRKMAANGLAKYRATAEPFNWDRAQITSRLELATNPTGNEDLGKIARLFSTEERLMEQSAVPMEQRNIQGTRDIFTDMLAMEAMSGSDTRKYTCPFFSLHYLAMKKVPQREGVVTGGKLFEIYDDEAFIRADPETVADVAIETCIVGSRAGAVGSQFWRFLFF